MLCCSNDIMHDVVDHWNLRKTVQKGQLRLIHLKIYVNLQVIVTTLDKIPTNIIFACGLQWNPPNVFLLKVDMGDHDSSVLKDARKFISSKIFKTHSMSTLLIDVTDIMFSSSYELETIENWDSSHI